MISVENLREHCRTCLVKLERTSKDDSMKLVPINKFPDLKQLIDVCFSKATVGGDTLCSYLPFLCGSCFNKWFDFSKLYQLTIETDEKIRKILEKELITDKINERVIKTTQDEKINEFFLNNETLVDIHEIEKYETDSPFFLNSHSSNQVNIKTQVGTYDDPTQANPEFEHAILSPAELGTKHDEDDVSSFYSDKSDCDTDFIFEEKKSRGNYMKNVQKGRITRKSYRIRKKSYKTRTTSHKGSDNHSTLNKGRKNYADLGEDRAKKVRYQCEQCNKYFWEEKKYDGHMKQAHQGIRRPYKCEECDKAYNLYKTLLQHKRECHSEKSREVFKCDKCDKSFKTGIILKQHLNNKHSEQKDALRSICDQCGFIAAHQYSLSRHIINKHTETDQIKCDQCPKVFKTQYSLKYHVIGNHNPSNMKPFKCPECQMGFTRKTLLNQHKRTHLKYDERIKCDFEGCEVRFVKHGDKTHHMRLVHLKVKQHICDFCGEAFGAMQTLRHHRFIHTGEKPYKCNICGQGFRQRTAMKTHRKTHSGKETERQDVTNDLPEINLSLVNM